MVCRHDNAQKKKIESTNLHINQPIYVPSNRRNVRKLTHIEPTNSPYPIDSANLPYPIYKSIRQI